MRETPDAAAEMAYIAEKQKIGVVGMSSGAGATFVATTLAKMLSHKDNRKVTFLEICGSTGKAGALTYDAIGFDKRFKTREFVRFYSEVKKGNNIRGRSNPDEQINWGLITPEDVKDEIELSPLEMMRLVNNISGDLIVCDMAAGGNAEDYLIDMDYVIFVIDPMPSGMIAGYPFLREVRRLEFRGKKVIWVLNKSNTGINKRDLQNFLKLKEHYKLPLMPAEHFYSAQYNCRIPYEMIDIRNEVKETMEKIIKKELELA
ncbi:MAG: hypothetical protein FWG42_04265 [Clostridiales bacterium]|nr:hypothetical protein [Clostridiales bacterium]